MKGFIKILLLLCALSLAKAKPVPETSNNLGEIWNVQDWGTVSEFETSLDEEEDEKAWDEDWDEEEDEEDWSEEEDEEAWDESDENPQWVEDSDLEGWNEPEWENDRSEEEKNDEGEEEGDEVETVDADPAIDDTNDESEGYEEIVVPMEESDVFEGEIRDFKRDLDLMQETFKGNFEIRQTRPAEETPHDVDFIASAVVCH